MIGQEIQLGEEVGGEYTDTLDHQQSHSPFIVSNTPQWIYLDGIHPIVIWQISSNLYNVIKHNQFY